MEMARSLVFLCGLHHRNLPGPNLKHICFRLCQVWYYFAISVFKKKFCVEVFSISTLFFIVLLPLSVSTIYFQERQ